mmetsp:Transcript_47224/g.107043  ORF Transcript_47224/g.107043 Transcript_47224/m.107043 type:complete len:289 (-) Transcript_47224:2260-3126(-)
MTLGHIAEHLSSLRANFQRLLNDLTVDATYGSNALSSQCCTSRIIEFERQHLSEILAFRLRPHHNIVNQNINRMGRKQNNPHPRVRIHSSLFADVYASLVYHDLSVFTNILSKSPVHTHFQRGSDQVALHEMLQAAQRLSAQDSRILWEFRHHIPPADRRYLYDMAHVVANQGCRPQRRHSQHRQNPNHIWCCFCPSRGHPASPQRRPARKEPPAEHKFHAPLAAARRDGKMPLSKTKKKGTAETTDCRLWPPCFSANSKSCRDCRTAGTTSAASLGNALIRQLKTLR